MSTLPGLLEATARPLGLAPRAAGVSGANPLNVDVPHQEQDCWCWCAVTVGIAKFYDRTFALSQCQTAARVLGIADACQRPTADDVNRMFDLDMSLAAFGRFDAMDLALSFAQVKRQIDTQRPVAARIRFMDSGLAHFAVIRGYRETPEQMLVIDDPLYDETEITYREFLTRYKGEGVWKQSYLTR